MIRSIILLILGIIIYPVATISDTILFEDGSSLTFSNPSELCSDHTPPVHIPAGFTNFNFYDSSIKDVQINQPENKPRGFAIANREAEASVLPLPATNFNLFNIHSTIQHATVLSELKPILTPQAMEALEVSVQNSRSQLFSLEMMQQMRPQKIELINSRLENNRGIFLVSGETSYGKTYGIIELVDENGWKLDKETWSAGKKAFAPDAVTDTLGQTFAEEMDVDNNRMFFKDNFPEYRFNRNVLRLKPAHNNIRKRNFMFVLFMSKPRVEEPMDDVHPQSPAYIKSKRQRLHILWTGPNKMMEKQKVIENEYPMDVTIANDDDGYAPGEMNLLLPKKRPNGVTASMMWTF